MSFDFSDKPNMRAKLNEAYTIALNPTGDTGSFAKVYDLLFAFISVNNQGDPIESEDDADDINLLLWEIDYDDKFESDWEAAPGVDRGAWIFLRGVSKVNWGLDNPEGAEAPYSKFNLSRILNAQSLAISNISVQTAFWKTFVARGLSAGSYGEGYKLISLDM